MPVSVDTFYAEVACAAIEAGASIVNDVSGGALDPAMHAEARGIFMLYLIKININNNLFTSMIWPTNLFFCVLMLNTYGGFGLHCCAPLCCVLEGVLIPWSMTGIGHPVGKSKRQRVTYQMSTELTATRHGRASLKSLTDASRKSKLSDNPKIDLCNRVLPDTGRAARRAVRAHAHARGSDIDAVPRQHGVRRCVRGSGRRAAGERRSRGRGRHRALAPHPRPGHVLLVRLAAFTAIWMCSCSARQCKLQT